MTQKKLELYKLYDGYTRDGKKMMILFSFEHSSTRAQQDTRIQDDITNIVLLTVVYIMYTIDIVRKRKKN